MPLFKKHDRVEFDHGKETLYGVVTKGGKRTSVTLDGAKLAYSVGESALRISTKPLPKDPPHPMDAYTLKSYREAAHLSEETTAFSAEIQKDGVSIIAARNSGHGGCNSYYPLSGGYAVTSQFEDDAKQWLIDHGMDESDVNEASDTWLVWKATQAPFGVTAVQYVEDWKEMLQEVRGDAPSGPRM